MRAESITMSERYAKAINSSHLEVDERRCGDVDVLIAAGWVPEFLGTTLDRLAAEFNQVRGDQSLIRRNALAKLALADNFDRTATNCRRAAGRLLARADYLKWLDAMLAATAASEQAARVRTEVADAIRVERPFVLLKLKTLASAKREVGEWARIRADREHFMPIGPFPKEPGPDQMARIAAWNQAAQARNAAIAAVAAKAIDVFLDDVCESCQGRGFNGGVGQPQVLCRGCKSTGRRSDGIGQNSAEYAFGFALLNSMQVLVDHASRAMRGFLSQREVA